MRSFHTALLERQPTRLLRVAALKTLRLRAATSGAQARSHVCPGVHFHAGKGVRLPGGGRVCWGTRRKQCRYHPSQPRLPDRATVEVKGDFHFKTGFEVLMDEGAAPRLGRGYVNSRVVLERLHETRIGPNVVIRDGDHHCADPSRPLSAPIVIGDKVWISDGAKIVQGVTSGTGAVVAAGAIVTRDVPARTLVAGVPAKVIREDVTWA